MKNFWRRMAAREGFTLVELVVVIAILAILAAVAYPAYTGYIGKANEAADLTELDAIKTAAQAAAAEKGGVQKIVVTVAASTGNVSAVTITPEDNSTIGTDENDLFTTLLGKKVTEITFNSAKYTKNKTACTITWTPASGWGDPAAAGG